MVKLLDVLKRCALLMDLCPMLPSLATSWKFEGELSRVLTANCRLEKKIWVLSVCMFGYFMLICLDNYNTKKLGMNVDNRKLKKCTSQTKQFNRI